jgi:hypothetical protein
MRRCFTYALGAGLTLAGLLLVQSPVRAGPRTAVYVTSRACEAHGLFTEEECRNAFANAEAEFHDVQVTVASEHERTVVPVLDGSHPAVSFGSRTVLDRRDFRSSLKQQDAQARWAAFQERLESPASTLRGPLDPSFAHAPPEPRLAALAPRLIEWCERFCGPLAGRSNREAAPPQPGTSLFSPGLDAGARSYDPGRTRYFSKQSPLSSRPMPRFLHKDEIQLRSSADEEG